MNIRREYLKITAPTAEVAVKKTKHEIGKIFRNPTLQFILFGVILLIYLSLSTNKEIDFIKNTAYKGVYDIMVYAIASIGFCLLLGYSGLASLGTSGFLGMGILLTYYSITKWELSVAPTFLIAGVSAIILGLVVGFISLRIEGIYLAIMTLCLSEIMRQLYIALEGGNLRINIKQIDFFGNIYNKGTLFDPVVYAFLAVVLVILLIFTANLIKSPTGRAMQAMKSSTSAAQAMGISLMKYRLLAFVIATLFATVAGVFFMLKQRNFTMTSGVQINLAFSLNILGAVIIGGAKSLWGALFGTFIVFGLKDVVFSDVPFFVENPDITYLVSGALIIVICMFFPGGFAEILLRIRLAIISFANKWRVRRYGIEE